MAILNQHFGEVEWADQVVSAVRSVVHKGIMQLSNMTVTQNERPLDGRYYYPARTAQELRDTQHLVAPVQDIEELEPESEPAPVVQKPKQNGWLM